MASQLVLAGEGVELVALLDAVTPQTPKSMPPASESRFECMKQMPDDFTKAEFTFAERARDVVQAINQKLVQAFVWRFRHYNAVWSRRVRLGLLRALLLHDLPWPRFVPELNLQDILNSLLERHSPKPISICSIVLARATSGEGADMPYSRIYYDKTLGWAAVSKSLTVLDVNGGHESMLQEPSVKSLAEALLPYVQQKPVQAKTRGIEFAQA
jgi:thioesterase domain-containing protein